MLDSVFTSVLKRWHVFSVRLLGLQIGANGPGHCGLSIACWSARVLLLVNGPKSDCGMSILSCFSVGSAALYIGKSVRFAMLINFLHVGFSKIRGTILWIPIVVMIIFGGLYWGAPILGNFHVDPASLCLDPFSPIIGSQGYIGVPNSEHGGMSSPQIPI